MTPDDQKASKKFVCASELARMFKSMICLFLTTSFLILNIKPGHLDGSATTMRTSTQIGPTLMDGAHEMIDEQPDLATFDDVTD